MNWFLVFLGGGLGSLARFGISQFLLTFSIKFPIATLVANALACFLFGVFFSLFQKNGLSENGRLVLMTGFCGGFSTFSTFAGDTFSLVESGQFALALLNIVGSLALCFGFLLLGVKIFA